MSNVLKFPQLDLKDCSYMDFDGDIGASMRDDSLGIVPINNGEEYVIQLKHKNGEMALSFNREHLAEFLHVATCLVDSECRWLPEFELIGRNYSD